MAAPLVALWLALACVPKGATPADVVLRGGVVHTQDPALPRAGAVALTGERIVWVGATRDARAYVGPDTRVVRLRGRAVLPGLIDTHNHLLWSGVELRDVDLFEVTSVEGLLAAVRDRAASEPDAPWIRGAGWDLAAFDGQLDRAQLDLAAGGRPVFLASADAHSAWVSTAALAAAGIGPETPDPPGGRIERDASGAPTGILRETAAELLDDVLPPYPVAQVDAGLDDALGLAGSLGITTVIDPAVEAWMLEGYQRRLDAGTLSVRVRGAVVVEPGSEDADIAVAAGLRGRFASDRLAVNAVKIYVDGVIETGTARLLAPYADGTNGPLLFTDEQLREVVAGCAVKGLQLHAHAIGDGAVRQVLDALAWLEHADGPADRRPLLAHLELIDPADVPRFAALGAFAAFQPLWAYPDPYIVDLTIPVIGPSRSEWLYPIGAVWEAGGVVVGGSDWSVSSMNPFEAMEVAVTRRDPERPGDALGPQHAVSVEQVLRAYTLDGARAVFLEDELGSVTVGKRADLVVVDRDPLTAPRLSRVNVRSTWVDGKVVYER